ncbi:putative thiazole-containing bacteriocin maturation protein [Paenibacillus mesophilus]|uniref:putative thiazole-containing bacteriocin maturation protein n=1 Tax=Paenibacillus mesophilus TaxID=2582849 RepID=UPI00110F68E2|nr:putative thiazole-containing bacteriocin maturation protein [Paenibacillus mesophilus]TMV43995.1 putative thiazole-containing bacteriocin maturation protein [Paenibacillus mesophilus]
MGHLTPAARLKVNGDTFFLPVPEGVYFRNNVGTFRMEGEMIDRWVEKLVPVFNGENTLAQITDGLSAPYRDRVYEIAEVLLDKGFARDVSQDAPHRLPDDILHKYGSQIAFLDSFGHSGAYRFQGYRKAGVLAVGSGPFFMSLVSALLESGLPKFHVLITDPASTNRQRLAQLTEHAKQTDAEADVLEVALPGQGAAAWRELVRPYESILYVSRDGDIEEIRMLQKACREERKMLLPAMIVHQTGMAGPLVHPESGACWESAWRRIHWPEVYKDPEVHRFSSTAGAMLANVIVFELFKTVTGAVESELRHSLYLLDLETLEGSWHKVMPHPLASAEARMPIEWIQDLEARIEGGSGGGVPNGLFPYLNRLTSKQTGILHIWDEGDLRQLPLSQCRVQAVDPLSGGPAELLPETVCNGFTHEEARREAGLTGIEAYVSRLAGTMTDGKHFVGIGVGETMAEAVARGIRACLTEKLAVRHADGKPVIVPAQWSMVEDHRCRYYLQSLTRMQGAPMIGVEENVSGFPVMWVGVGNRWYGAVGLNLTLALRGALQAALLTVQNEPDRRAVQALEVSSVLKGRGEPVHITVPSSEGIVQPAVLREALHVLASNNQHLHIADMAVEPFMKEVPLAVTGVVLREGEPG